MSVSGNKYFSSLKVVNDEENTHLMPFVNKVFKQRITPIYGPQEKAISLILKSVDRRCEVLLATPEPATSRSPPGEPVGLVVYKIKPNDEFASFGVKHSVEIKTLCLADPSRSSGKGYGSALLNQVIEYAKKNGANGAHVTVSNSKPDSRSFFMKKGFKDLCPLTKNLQEEERLYYYGISCTGTDEQRNIARTGHMATISG